MLLHGADAESATLVDVHLDDDHLGLRPVSKRAAVPYFLISRGEIDSVTRHDLVTAIRLRAEPPIELTAYRGAALDEVYEGAVPPEVVARAARRFEPLADLAPHERTRYRRALVGLLVACVVAATAFELLGWRWGTVGVVLGAAVALGTGWLHKLLVTVVRGSSAVAEGRRREAPPRLLIVLAAILAPLTALAVGSVLLPSPALRVVAFALVTLATLLASCLALGVAWDHAAGLGLRRANGAPLRDLDG